MVQGLGFFLFRVLTRGSHRDDTEKPIWELQYIIAKFIRESEVHGKI